MRDELTDVPGTVVATLRATCLGLPEVFEEQAWTGVRWRVRSQTFAHVLRIVDGWPPAYARAAGSDGPLTVLTFRAAGAQLEALRRAGHPFFKPVWFPDIVGMIVDDDTDWMAVDALLTESYRIMAPRRLASLVDQRAS